MKKTLVIVFAAIAAVATLIVSSRNTPSGAVPVPEKKVQYPFQLTFNPDVPKNLPEDADSVALISFAWNEFFALNWKSTYNTITKERGYPDKKWSLSTNVPYPQEPVVWETYAHRTELRPYNDTMLAFDKIPKYVYQTTPVVGAGVDFTLFNNLDENNEIGSCDLYAKIIQYGKQLQVLYQAKVNRDEYMYLYNHYPDSNKLKKAINTTAANIKQFSAYYSPTLYPSYGGTTCNCPPQANVVCLPCGGAKIPGTTRATYVGALEVKTAWREIFPEEAARYFVRKVITYEKSGNSTIVQNKYYGLIGIHIIRKMLNFPSFVFATFEHVDVEVNDMGLVRLDTLPTPEQIPQRYKRAHPIPAVVDSSTAYAHRELKKINPNSIWKYYRLVGVQGNPTDDTKSFSYYLANYVIESDPPLANFRGSSIKHPYDGGKNSLYKGQFYTMGGCQGCHGVTQLRGSDCSFVMGLVDQPHATPDISRATDKLELYKQAFLSISGMGNKK